MRKFWRVVYYQRSIFLCLTCFKLQPTWTGQTNTTKTSCEKNPWYHSLVVTLNATSIRPSSYSHKFNKSFDLLHPSIMPKSKPQKYNNTMRPLMSYAYEGMTYSAQYVFTHDKLLVVMPDKIMEYLMIQAYKKPWANLGVNHHIK